MKIIQKLRLVLSVALLSSSLAVNNSFAFDGNSKTKQPETNLSRAYQTAALIYNGAGTATGDVEAIAEILNRQNLTYQIATSEELNTMSLDELAQFGVIVWPGGYAGLMSESLLPSTRTLISQAVNERGVSFVGICAGAFIAISPSSVQGAEGPAWGLSIIPGEVLPYYHLENEGVEYTMVKVKLANHSERSLLWWGGPVLPEFAQGVIARYLDTGEPAIIQTWAGKGLVLLAGPHPESPEEWRTKLGLSDPDGLDQDIAGAMLEAAVTQQPMATLRARKEINDTVRAQISGSFG